jgi:hypothetical protein
MLLCRKEFVTVNTVCRNQPLKARAVLATLEDSEAI